MIDIFSRKAVHWEVHATETGELAKAFMENAVIANGGARPAFIHADSGTSMTSKPVADLLADLHIAKSHSRPHVSNDNPYSEAQFKTLKYCPVFPGSFTSLGEAAAFCQIFFHYYNSEHRHSGIGLYTPQSVHDGTARKIRQRRQEILDAAYAAHSERFRSHSVAPKLPGKVWINKPRPTIVTQEATQIIKPPDVSRRLTGSDVGLLGGFAVASFPDETPGMAYLETPDEGEITKDPVTVNKITVTYDLLRASALSASASRDLIAKVAEQRWN